MHHDIERQLAQETGHFPPPTVRDPQRALRFGSICGPDRARGSAFTCMQPHGNRGRSESVSSGNGGRDIAAQHDGGRRPIPARRPPAQVAVDVAVAGNGDLCHRSISSPGLFAPRRASGPLSRRCLAPIRFEENLTACGSASYSQAAPGAAARSARAEEHGDSARPTEVLEHGDLARHERGGARRGDRVRSARGGRDRRARGPLGSSRAGSERASRRHASSGPWPSGRRRWARAPSNGTLSCMRSGIYERMGAQASPPELGPSALANWSRRWGSTCDADRRPLRHPRANAAGAGGGRAGIGRRPRRARRRHRVWGLFLLETLSLLRSLSVPR